MAAEIVGWLLTRDTPCDNCPNPAEVIVGDSLTYDVLGELCGDCSSGIATDRIAEAFAKAIDRE